MANGIIQVDPRVGSKELLPYFTRGRAQISTTQIPADFHFMGNGPTGPCLVGFERKTTGEFIGDYARFANNQLTPLLNTYKFPYLIIEGAYRVTADGHIELWEKGRWQDRGYDRRAPTFKIMIGRMHTLMRKLNLHIIQTLNMHHTALTVECIYNWYQKDWADHESYNVEYTAPPQHVMPRMPTIMEKMLVQVPALGWKRAIALAAQYPKMCDLVKASAGELSEFKVGQRRLGPKAASEIKQFIGGTTK